MSRDYTISNDGRILRGSAENVLREIQAQASDDSDVKGMTLDAYAESLIDSADYFVPRTALQVLRGIRYDTEFDKALAHLAAMPASGVTILAQSESGLVGQRHRG
jgi:hypothetical protein